MATDARSADSQVAPLASPVHPPAKLGYREYCCFPDDGRRHEIIDGDHVMTPAPSTTHQTVSKRLQHQLYTQIELSDRGLVFNAPVDVQLTEYDIVQPDLVVVLKVPVDRTRMITHTKINGVPDLIVEILSPSTAAIIALAMILDSAAAMSPPCAGSANRALRA
jgi:hypothetical protein